MVVVCYIEKIMLGVNRDNISFHKKDKKKTLLLTDSPNSLIWCQWRGEDYDFTYLINLYLFVEIIQGWSFFIPNLLSSCHFLGVEESLFWQSHSSTGTECGGSSWAAVGPEYRQNHKWVIWLTIKACTDLNFFSRPYFHHCLRSVHYCEGRFHIHFLNRNSHIWFSYILSHEQSSYRKRRTEKERNWTGNQCRISHAIQSLTYGPNIFAICLLQYPFQIPTINPVFRQTNSNHLITMISVIKSWKPDVRTTYLGSLSFSFLDFSDVCDALDRISSDRFIFLGWATIFPARNSSNVRCTSCIHKNAYSRNVARKLCNQFMIVFFCC